MPIPIPHSVSAVRNRRRQTFLQANPANVSRIVWAFSKLRNFQEEDQPTVPAPRMSTVKKPPAHSSLPLA
jgi:hypothetical protein